MVHFDYVWVGQKLIRRIAEQVRQGENIVLLGYRNSGKTHLQNKIAGALRDSQSAPVVLARFRDRQRIETIEDARNAVAAALNAPVSIGQPVQDILSPLDSLAPQRPIVIATNIDSMPFAIARRLLAEIRERVLSNRLVAVLSGEYYLRELVVGRNSEFNIANHYLVQGLDESEFKEEFLRLTDWLKVDWDHRISHDLWEETGGNPALLRVIMWVVVEWRARAGHLANKKVSIALIRGLLERRPFQELVEGEVLRAANRLVPMEPAVWSNLSRLRNGDDVALPRPGSPPMALTLSGIAIQESGVLKVASPLMGRLIRVCFSDRRIGDLFASKGDWDIAFRYYAGPSLVLPRPGSAEDLPETVAVLRALCSELHRCDDQGPDAVAARFEQGCRLILGFTHVSLWKFSGVWRPLGTLAEAELAAGLEVLELADQFTFGELPVPEKWRGTIFAAKLRSERSDQPMAVIVGDVQRTQVSEDRAGLLRDLLNDFGGAYAHAVNIVSTTKKLNARETHARVIEKFVKSLQTSIPNANLCKAMKAALTEVAIQLCQLGYRSVGFWLVDNHAKWIAPVCYGGLSGPLEPVSFSDPTASIHGLVAGTVTPVRLPNATRPVLNDMVPEAWRGRGLAVIPILGTVGSPLGTIWVETEDSIPPSAHEVDDFLEFGRILGPLIEEARRESLLLLALDYYPEALVVLDQRQEQRYANRAAASLLGGIQPGWVIGAEARLPPIRSLSKSIVEALAGKRFAGNVDQLGEDPNAAWSVFCQPMRDEASVITGALVSFRSLTTIYQLLPVLIGLAGAEDREAANIVLIDAFKTLGFPAARLYAVEGDKLRGQLQFGLPDDHRAANRFRNGNVVLPDNDLCWTCLEEQKPIPFRLSRNGELFTNAFGLTFVSAENSCFPWEENDEVGACWIDIPVIVSGKRLAKISVRCNPEYSPEGIAFLQIFAEMISQVLSAVLPRERAIVQRKEDIRKIGERSLGLLAHSIATRFGGLSLLFYSYEDLEKHIPSFSMVNESFRVAYSEILELVKRAKEMLGGIQPVLSDFDIVDHVRDRMKRILPASTWQLNAEGPLIVSADQVLLGGAIAEIIKNAQEAIPEPDLLRLSVTVGEVQRNGAGWVRIQFEDNGPGVSPEIRGRIFEDFYTHHPGREPGLGLGLSFVRRIVNAHNGEVRECGSVGHGARFEIDIPIIDIPMAVLEEGNLVQSDAS